MPYCLATLLVYMALGETIRKIWILLPLAFALTGRRIVYRKTESKFFYFIRKFFYFDISIKRKFFYFAFIFLGNSFILLLFCVISNPTERKFFHFIMELFYFTFLIIISCHSITLFAFLLEYSPDNIRELSQIKFALRGG